MSARRRYRAMGKRQTREEIDTTHSLGDLIAWAEDEWLSGTAMYTRWLEQYYDPAKAALLDLMVENAVLLEQVTR